MKNTTAKLGALLSLLTLSAALGGSIQYRWGSVDNDLTNKDGEIILWGDATVLTYATQDTTINFDSTIPLANTYGNDILHSAMQNWTQFPSPEGGIYSTKDVFESSSAVIGHYLYAVVLDLPFAQFSDVESIPAGTHFGISGIGVDSNEPGIYLALHDTTRFPSQTFSGGAVQTSYSITTIPEPGALVLLGLGILSLLWHRRFSLN